MGIRGQQTSEFSCAATHVEFWMLRNSEPLCSVQQFIGPSVLPIFLIRGAFSRQKGQTFEVFQSGYRIRWRQVSRSM